MNEKKEKRGQITRERIINAAGELFAEQGFEGTTIRDICTQAEVNNASVNYHFRDKENLFAEVIRYGFTAAHEKYPPDYNFKNTKNAQERLRQFIWNMLIRKFDPELPQWFSRLISRNIQFAHSHKKEVLKGHKHKVSSAISGILSELIEKEGACRQEMIRIAEAGVIGIVLFHLHAGPHDEDQRFPVLETREAFEQFVDCLYSFTLAGIQALNSEI